MFVCLQFRTYSSEPARRTTKYMYVRTYSGSTGMRIEHSSVWKSQAIQKGSCASARRIDTREGGLVWPTTVAWAANDVLQLVLEDGSSISGATPCRWYTYGGVWCTQQSWTKTRFTCGSLSAQVNTVVYTTCKLRFTSNQWYSSTTYIVKHVQCTRVPNMFSFSWLSLSS